MINFFKNKKNVVMAVCLILAVILAVFVFILKRDSLVIGWHEDENGKWYVKFPLSRASGLTTLGGDEYYFESYGNKYMKTGWFKYDGFYHYANEDGKVLYGEQTIDGEKYFFDETSGKLYKDNAYIIDGKLWYFDSHGFKVYGIVELNGEKFCFSEKGNLERGLRYIDGKYYYFDDKNESMVFGLKTVGGATYYFDEETGEAIVGEKIINGTTYVFGEDGKRIN